MSRIERYGLQVDTKFAEFIETKAIPGTGVESQQFWNGLSTIVHELGAENANLLNKRQLIQNKLDQWYLERQSKPINLNDYQKMLREIGYIVPSGGKFSIQTSGIDLEISSIAGPQLVVPVTNARFAINAANARWNSLYNALYGTDALGSMPEGKTDAHDRRQKVVAWAKAFLDDIFTLDQGSHNTAIFYEVKNNQLLIKHEDGSQSRLADQSQFVGYLGSRSCPTIILLCNNNLHVEIHIDRSNAIGSADSAGISDIVLEAAVTTIMDCEDSVAVVNAEDKILAYTNWLGLMKSDLEVQVNKNNQSFVRRLNSDREYKSINGGILTLKGLSLLLVRNVGLLMTSPAILNRSGDEIFEGLLDAMCTVLIALHDIRGQRRNSSNGSIYVVKPKLHGPKEVAFCCKVFAEVERWLGLAKNTVKLGIMDEERRTTVNLRECIRAAINRVAFINTGFLDRTGDEIHTSMEAGPFLRKKDIKSADWLTAYEDWNTETGIACGMIGAGQIGKGMWAMPDLMQAMLNQKIEHPMAGASTAWVPSPTAAVLHATHYHRVNVTDRQLEIQASQRQTELSRILNIPLAQGCNWSDDEIREEIENNLQGILGYVVRWVDQGIGCSKVPDISEIQLMEDRATCRISSQHVANWLHHKIVDREFVEATFKRMALIVDQQNQDDPNYKPMGPEFDGLAFNAARKLVFEGIKQPSGYTEPILHRYRQQTKQQV